MGLELGWIPPMSLCTIVLCYRWNYYLAGHLTGNHGFFDFLDTGRDSPEHFCLGDSLYASPGNAGLPDPNEWKYGILLAAEEVVRAGVLSYAPGSESEHVSPFHPS